MERPVSAFENCKDMVLPLVDGINMHHSNSFPSGHASTFFVFCTCCALLMAYRFTLREQSGKRWLLYGASMLGLLLLATLGAYSRVYLSQHFLSDICMGSIIGFTTPFLIFFFARKKLITHF